MLRSLVMAVRISRKLMAIMRLIIQPTLLALTSVWLLTSCASLTADVARSWNHGHAYLPGGGTLKIHELAHGPVPEQRLPAVLYLHGCNGIGTHTLKWAEWLRSEGFVVFVPDSFAREYPPQKCQGGRMSSLGDALARLSNVHLALDMIRKTPWVDPERVVLMGHSQGGFLAAIWRWGGFRAYIISGWTCTHPDSSYAGIAASRAPVLAVNFDEDPFYPGPMKGRCLRHFANDGSREIILPGTGHGTADSPTAIEGVKRFLREDR